MIIEKLIKSTSNGVGYITIPANLIGENIEIIINKKIIKKKNNTHNLIYLKKEYIGMKCYINLD